MSKTTVTAEEFIVINGDCDFRLSESGSYLSDTMIEFAKMKCREMQEAILEKAEISLIDTFDGNIPNYKIDKQSILQAYDIESIK